MKTINIEEYEKFEEAVEAGLSVADDHYYDPLQARKVAAFHEAKEKLGESLYIDLLEDVFDALISDKEVSQYPSFTSLASAANNIQNAMNNWSSVVKRGGLKYGLKPNKRGAAKALIDEIKSLNKESFSPTELFNMLSLWLALKSYL
ncbi:hypothetical protein CTH30272_03053 [Allocatenococcus thiocycli]|nr:hypothetical protein CTH30272_03053 [Catenococcus thiocycli]